MAYIVKTRDTDGSGTRRFKTLAGAVKRFEEMVGYSVAAAIDEVYYDRRVPTIEELTSLRAVSNFGTVITFTATEEHADAARAAWAAAVAAAAAPVAAPAPAAAYTPVVRTACADDCTYCLGTGNDDPEDMNTICLVCLGTGKAGARGPQPDDFHVPHEDEAAAQRLAGFDPRTDSEIPF